MVAVQLLNHTRSNPQVVRASSAPTRPYAYCVYCVYCVYVWMSGHPVWTSSDTDTTEEKHRSA